MADDTQTGKGGTEGASNANNAVNKTGAPGTPGAPVVTPAPQTPGETLLPPGHMHELSAPKIPETVQPPAPKQKAPSNEPLPPLLHVEKNPTPATPPPTLDGALAPASTPRAQSVVPQPKPAFAPLMPEVKQEAPPTPPTPSTPSVAPSLSDKIGNIVNANTVTSEPPPPRPLAPLPGEIPAPQTPPGVVTPSPLSAPIPTIVKPAGLAPAQDRSVPEPVILNETIIPKKTGTPEPARPERPDNTFAPPRNVGALQPPATPLVERETPNTSPSSASFGPLSMRQEDKTLSQQTGEVKKGFFDISNVLKGIKLPERYAPKVSGEAKPLMPKVTPAPEPPPFVPKITKPFPPTPETKPPEPQKATLDAAPQSDGGKKVSTGEAVENVSGEAVTHMRTFKEDMMHIVRDRKISIVKAVALEEDKKSKIKQPTPAEIQMHRQRRRRIFAVLFTVGILTFLGSAALFGVYTIEQQRTALPKMPGNQGMIFAEQSLSFPLQDITSGEIKRVLAQARGSSNAALGSITRVVPTLPVMNEAGQAIGVRGATLGEFLDAVDATAPEKLLRALDSEFFFGIHTVDENAPLLIVRVLSYEHAFAGMLEWEKAINTDLAPAFTALPSFMTGENGLPVQRTFYDVVMRNYDVRAMKDDAGQIQLYYSFPTPKILIIAESTYSFTEILTRLQAARNL